MSGGALFTLGVTAAAGLAVFALAGLWARGALRRHWVSGTGCPACAWMDGECSCDRKCISPDCKGGEGR